VEYRFTEGRNEEFRALAAELVALEVDLIVAVATGIQAAKDATTTIPIVMTSSADPVGAGLVASLARPGGNVTGLSQAAPQLSGKRLEWLKATVPGLSRVAILWGPANPGLMLSFRELELAAQTLGVEVLSLEVRDAEDFAPAFETAIHEQAQGLITLASSLTFYNRARIAELAAKSRVPAMYELRRFPEAGGLMSYGPSSAHLFRRAAYYVDRILKGAKPADLPVEQPREFDFVINLQTAHALSLTIPPHVLLQATEVIP
jgi:putative ABC transport system substrate-binding protein